MSDPLEAGTAAAPPPSALERENSLEDFDDNASLREEGDPEEPGSNGGLDDSSALDEPLPGNAYDDDLEEDDDEPERETPSRNTASEVLLVPETDTETAEVHEARVNEPPPSNESNDPDSTAGPVEEFPPDNTPDVTVTFVIQPENFVHRVAVKATATGHDLKEKVVSELPLPWDALSLRYQDEEFQDDLALMDVSVKPGGAVTMELVVKFAPEEVEADDESDPKNQSLPNSIEVVVDGDDGDNKKKIITVTIDASVSQKPRYLGGYRDVRNGRAYHHASVQTDSQNKKEFTLKFTTETQTFELRTRRAQTQRESSTQMQRPDMLLSNNKDVHVRVGRYVTAEETLAVKQEKAVVLQRFARGARDRRRACFLRTKRDAEFQKAREDSELALEKETNQRSFDISRRMTPQTPSDFALLQSEFDAWRVGELQKIDAAFPQVVQSDGFAESRTIAESERAAKLGAALYATAKPVTLGSDTDDAKVASALRKRAVAALLAKETKMLLAIGRLKKAAKAVNDRERVRDALDDMARSKNWEKKDGAVVVVDTTQVIRARELKQLYDACVLADVTVDTRLEILNHLRWTVKEFSTKLVREILELLDRCVFCAHRIPRLPVCSYETLTTFLPQSQRERLARARAGFPQHGRFTETNRQPVPELHRNPGTQPGGVAVLGEGAGERGTGTGTGDGTSREGDENSRQSRIARGFLIRTYYCIVQHTDTVT
jgi:hypothetical protein